MAIIEIKNLTFCYPQGGKPALDNLSLELQEGDFFVLCGASGCGKSTLLRQLKPQIAPVGDKNGDIYFNGENINNLTEKASASGIGFVHQSPDNQIVTDKVWHELAFGMESLGFDNGTIRGRVAETTSFFGIENWFYKDVSTLSGGQKQILNLASVMVMQPKVLVLDEPTSQLDPIAASEFLNVLKKINNELGTTVILSEHRLEEAIPLSNKVAIMDKGKIICCDKAENIADFLKKENSEILISMPTAMQIWASVESNEKSPISVNEGKRFLKEYTKNIALNKIEKNESVNNNEEVVSGKDLYFKYEKNAPDILKNTNISVKKGEFFCLLGGNGTGKTTLLKVLSGIKKPYRGSVKIDGKIALLPQNPEALFSKKTVYEDLENIVKNDEEKEKKIADILELCDLVGFENRHPYDLSGGEKQKLGIAKLLLTNPDILFLDEPTKGLDGIFKNELAEILKSLLNEGVAIVMVSHDIEFCARYAHKCALFFDGKIVTQNEPREFFKGNSFYTTAAHRIARDIIPEAILTEDIIKAIGGKTIKINKDKPKNYTKPKNKYIEEKKKTKLPLWRKICGSICGVISFLIFLYTTKTGALSESINSEGITKLGLQQMLIYGVFILFLILTAAFVTKKSQNKGTQPIKSKLPKRTIFSIVIILLLIPLTLFLGFEILETKQYYITSLFVLLECMLPFFLAFEGRRPKAREIVTIAVLCALAIAGRAAFFMVPQFKPVIALTIIAGVALGGETGFLVGAVTMLCSNMLFSQGPWTPWQMFSAGLIGFLAGLLYKKGFLQRSRASLCVFGAIATILIYGGIMNPSSALIWGGEALNLKMLLSYYVTGFPMDVIHAFATVIFLWFLSDTMLEKLDRIKIKYGFI